MGCEVGRLSADQVTIKTFFQAKGIQRSVTTKGCVWNLTKTNKAEATKRALHRQRSNSIPVLHVGERPESLGQLGWPPPPPLQFRLHLQHGYAVQRSTQENANPTRFLVRNNKEVS